MLTETGPKRIVVVGGGLAGLAAASALVDRGHAITLLESRPRLGGRASSFQDPLTGELVDNCQHVSMTCCTNLADFCRRVGTADLFRKVPDITFLSPEGKVCKLQGGPLPAPLHLTGSFLTANYLTFAERLRVAYGMACLRFARTDGPESRRPFSDWLLDHGQTIRTINRYWGTVLISALNERVEQMDLGHARKVFIDGFLRNKHGYVMEIPLTPLGDLYGQRLDRWLRDKGVDLRLTTGVRQLELNPADSVSGILLRDGTTIEADAVILAVPFDRILDMLPEGTKGRIPGGDSIETIESSPITGVHLWFDREVCPFEHVVTVGRTVQWVFDHTRIQGRRSADGEGQYLQVVISASYDLLAMDKAAIRDAVLADLAEMWPATEDAQLKRWWVVTEHGATFAVRPGIDAIRPAQRTEIPGLHLAGDWTDTGWPATMEGAVRSGYLAAEGVLADLGESAHLVQPDLPDTWLSRALLGPR